MSPHRALTLLAVGLACAPVGSLGKDGMADTGANTTSSTDTSGNPPASSETGSDGASMATTSATSTSETSSGSDGSTSSETTHAGTTGVHECPPDVDDDACTTCTEGHCCAEVSACEADPTCMCIHECHAGGTAVAECEVMCGMDDGENAALEHCIVEQCVAACP